MPCGALVLAVVSRRKGAGVDGVITISAMRCVLPIRENNIQHTAACCHDPMVNGRNIGMWWEACFVPYILICM